MWKGTLPFTSEVETGAKRVAGQIVFDITIKTLRGSYTYSLSNFRHVSIKDAQGRNGVSFGVIGNAPPVLSATDFYGENWTKEVWEELQTLVNNAAPPLVQTLKAAMQVEIKKQPVSTAAPLTITGQVPISSNLNAGQAWRNALGWFVVAYPQASISLADANAHILLGKATVPYACNYCTGSFITEGNLTFDVQLQRTGNNWQYRFTNFYHASSALAGSSFGLITTDAECPYTIAFTTGHSADNIVWNDIKRVIDLYVTAGKTLLDAAMQITVTENTDALLTKSTLAFTEVVTPTTTGSKSELYGRGARWFSQVFNGVGGSLLSADKDNAEFTGAIATPFPSRTAAAEDALTGEILFNVSVEVKDNKYRYNLSDFRFRTANPNRVTYLSATGCAENGLYYTYIGYTCHEWTDVLNTANTTAGTVITSLKTAMQTPLPPRNEGW